MNSSRVSLRAKTPAQSLQLRAQAELELRRRRQALQGLDQGTAAARWPTLAEYRNAETGHVYLPHHAAEHGFIVDDAPRYALAKGGEGGGKSVAGIIKDLERLRRGCSGIMVSPDFVHFKKSLWPEFRRWCPWDMVVDSQRRRSSKEWEPSGPFTMVFDNGAMLLCGGIEEPGSWDGPNVNFAHIDEARRCRDAGALKTLDGRVRIPGPAGEPAQMWLTTTPRKNWLFEYFGPIIRTEAGEPDDPKADFKGNARVIDLLTIDNERAGNVEAGYTAARRQTLTEAEARVLLEAAWEDIDEAERFLPAMVLWDNCRDALPPLGKDEPCVIALDAGIHNDSFGLVIATRHPARRADVAIRYVQDWKPVGGQINFQGTDEHPGPEMILRKMTERLDGERPRYNVQCVTYDPYQLHDLSQRLADLAWFREFGQGADRLTADKQLFDLIVNRRIAHDGDLRLRTHIDNANRKPDPETRKLRLVKREPGLKIDLAVCASMASFVCLALDL